MKISTANLPGILEVSLLLCAVSLTVMVLVLSLPRQNRVEFTPPPFEENAVSGAPEVPEELGWNQIDASVFRASVCGHIVPSDGSADVWLYSAEDNTVWLKMRILDEAGNILGETGILKPGEYVRSVKLDRVPASGTPVILKLMSYTPETYHSEGAVTLNTLIGE